MRAMVTPRVRTRPDDRAGDPLDGLVNLFDLGIVLAVAFLLAALSSLKLSDLLTRKDVTLVRSGKSGNVVIVKQGAQVRELKLSGQRVVGQGTKVGSVFRLADGRTVYVQDSDVGSLPPGAIGPSGASGSTGAKGTSGTSGAQGTSGAGGATGSSGSSGTSGPNTGGTSAGKP